MVDNEEEDPVPETYDQIFAEKRRQREQVAKNEAKETQRREEERKAGEEALRKVVHPRLEFHAEQLHDRHDGTHRWLSQARIRSVTGVGTPNTIRAVLVVDRQPDGGPKPGKEELTFHKSQGRIVARASTELPKALRAEKRVDGVDEPYIDQVVTAFVESIHDE